MDSVADGKTKWEECLAVNETRFANPDFLWCPGTKWPFGKNRFVTTANRKNTVKFHAPPSKHLCKWKRATNRAFRYATILRRRIQIQNKKISIIPKITTQKEIVYENLTKWLKLCLPTITIRIKWFNDAKPLEIGRLVLRTGMAR
jgi:hypothetical protein